MKPEYKTVEFGSKEFRKITELRRQVFCDEGKEKTSFIKDTRDNTGVHVAYFLGDAVVGCASGYNNGKGEFQLSQVAVGEDYRRFGIGTELVKRVKAEMKKQGAQVIVAECPTEYLDFFHSLGMPHNNVSFKRNGRRYIKCVQNLVFDDSRWVTFGNENEAVIARGEFNLDKKEKTEISVSGLGYCHIYVNGRNISDRLLAPAWTNYRQTNTVDMYLPIFDKMTYRILYEKIDITDFVKKGKNKIEFHIGGGWYSQHECPNEGITPYGNLTLCFKITSGKKLLLTSDENLVYRKSYITRASVYYGEEQDTRIGGYDFKESDNEGEWLNATAVEAPLAVLSLQDCLPDKVIRKIKPKCVFRRGDYAIYDVGQNVSGYPVIKFGSNARRGEECEIRYAENLNDDGSMNFWSAGGEFRMQKDKFIYDGKCGELYPQFTWHGARYLEVTGNIEIKTYCVVHTDLKQIVKFKSSNETIQWIFDAYVNTQLCNVHGCIPSDCPHRERLGYTGDGQLTADTVMLCFDAEKMYRKWIRDIADSQDIYNGHVQHTAPYYGGGGGPGGWGGAIVFVPYSFYKAYGDKELVKEYYNNMLLYLDYMQSHSKDGIVVSEEHLGWCLGDWCSPGNKNLIPIPFVNTYFHIKALQQVIELSRAIGESTKELEARLKYVKKAFLDKYYNSEKGTFADSAESADAYGYSLGLGNKKTLKAIVDKYNKLGQFDTGIFGTALLIKVLCENGNEDLAFRLLTSEKENTFYNMKKQGATTLWENWDGCDSHSHPMFGAVVEYIVKYFNEI